MVTVRAAITQTTWTGDKESMLDKHEQFARDAAAQGAQVICFQELFYGPYFGITQDRKYYAFAEPVDGPIVQRFSALAINPDFRRRMPEGAFAAQWNRIEAACAIWAMTLIALVVFVALLAVAIITKG